MVRTGQLPAHIVTFVLLLGCGFASVSLAVAPREYRLEGGGTIAPHVALEIGSDNNPLRSEDGSGQSAFLRLEPSVRYTVTQRNNNLAFSYVGDFVQYTEEYCRFSVTGNCQPGATGFDKASFQNHRLSADAFVEANRRLRFTGNLSIARQNQPLGTGLSANSAILARLFEPDAFRSAFARVGLSYGAARAKGEIRASITAASRDYEDPGDSVRGDLSELDENSLSPRAALFYRLGSRTQVFGGLQVNQVRGGNSERDNRELFGGVEFDSSGITTGTISVSAVDQDFVDQSREDSNFFGFDVALTWRPRTFSTVVISGGREAERGRFNTSGVGITTTLGVDWTHEWSDLFSTDLQVELLNNREDVEQNSAAQRGDETGTSIRLEGSYSIRRWLDIGAFVESDRQSGEDNSGASRDFSRSVVGLTANGTI